LQRLLQPLSLLPQGSLPRPNHPLTPFLRQRIPHLLMIGKRDFQTMDFISVPPPFSGKLV
jgi:hypothetical protein